MTKSDSSFCVILYYVVIVLLRNVYFCCVRFGSGGMLAWLSGMRCRLAYSPADATANHHLLLQ